MDSVIINERKYVPEDNQLPTNWKDLLHQLKKPGYILPDVDVIKYFEHASGRKYNSDKDPCVNDFRRFFEIALFEDKLNIY